jgi:uncharacterized protein YqjF (DUF2071 family)
MSASLKNHPFAVEAFFESSLVLSYAAPKEQLAHLIPPCLELDTFNDTWAFVAVAIVKTKALRPKGFPAFAGNDFILSGYRVFVRYKTREGKRLRGLYILGSETDKKKMAFLGNIFTHYNYSSTDIRLQNSAAKIRVHSVKSGLDLEVNITGEPVLPEHSPFRNWKEARRFAGPLPFTFTYNAATGEVLIIEGVRDQWTPRPVTVVKQNVGFIAALQIPGAVLANAFLVENIPYYWKKGKTDLWKQS